MAEQEYLILEVPCSVAVYQTLRAEGLDEDDLQQKARESLAVCLYQEHRLSLGKAAQLAGIPIVQFMNILRELKMPVTFYGEAEYSQDLKTMEFLNRQREEAG